MNTKSDRKAKEEFCKKLTTEGFDSVEITATPADIMATKDGETWWFEIKQTTQEKTILELLLKPNGNKHLQTQTISDL